MTDASTITYTASGTGAVTTNVGAKLNEIPSIIDYGGDPTGVTSCTAAFNAALAAASTGGHRRIYFPTGVYKFNTRPNQINTAVLIDGDGLNQTVLVRNYNEAGGSAAGFMAFTAGSNGSILRGCAVESEAGTSGGSMISIVSTSTYAVSAITLEDLWVTTRGSATHETTVWIDGRAKTGDPNGARTNKMRGCHIFGATGYSVVLFGVSGFSWYGGGCYEAGGSGPVSGGIQVGGTDGGLQSTNVTIDIENCRYLNLSDVHEASFRFGAVANYNSPVAGYSVDNSGSAVNCVVHANYFTGSVRGNWVTSGVYRPTGWSAT